ncbi:GFA family protein [Devosia sp. MC521]|uniref:GFA family protein n=1 Tax=Devosia sp. MC521 TaxID=2759954 RepID=UPI0015FB3B31|nr:GFA family protein [Devosia sp. MC521]MBJ6987495.1 GFA family protein [Devosia sp. MC521]QMW61855.1 GFA family protein [Devosia sp. MC521]
MALTASCHCGAIKFEIASAPSEAHTCNCSYCQRSGAVWTGVKPEDFKLLSNSAEGTYNPTGLNVHHFCAACGMQTWGDSPDWSAIYNDDGTLKPGATEGVPETRSMYFNLNLVDDFDRTCIPITAMDGRNNW